MSDTFDTELETVLQLKIRITHYTPGKDGDHPGMGPPMSYASINPPEPEEIEFNVLDADGDEIPGLGNILTDDDFEELEEIALEHARK